MFQKFIHRPVFAIVISIIIVFMGVLAIKMLPVSQFPEVAPPRVVVNLSFPGASADVLVKTAIITLEQAINGVPGMRYIVSASTSAGEATIQVLFHPGTDPNSALVQTKARVDAMRSRLPPLVNLEGVTVMTVQPSMLMYVNLYSTDKNADEKFLYNYANTFLLNELKRVEGIGLANIIGARQYAMKIWLDPDRMRAYNISTKDVMDAIAEQSLIARPGRTGQSAGKIAQSIEYVLVYEGRFSTPQQYGEIILRASNEGETLYLKDVAKVELDSEFYNIYSDVDGYPSAAIVFRQVAGSNASQVIEQIKEKLKELKKTFPPGMDYKISYDVSNFLDASIDKVMHTLVEAFILVALVVFVFLGDWRSTLIPTIAVPVSLIGAFFFMKTFGLTINLITLFAMVLAIGVVVDDAIVVVEAVHAKMAEEHLSPFGAIKLVLNEISGAVIAITFLMTAVFIPVTFLPGPVGVFYREFAITMATSIVLSGVVALTLTPVLCAMILKGHHEHKEKTLNPITKFLNVFNYYFEILTSKYIFLLRKIVHHRILTLAILGGFVAGIIIISTVVPPGFVPAEDQGQIYAIIQTPPGSTIEKTYDVAGKLRKVAEKIEGVESVATLAGYEILTEGRGSNAGTCLINLKNWSLRKNTVHDVIEQLEEKTRDFGAVIEYFEPPDVPGFGAAGGISARLLDKTQRDDYEAFDKIVSEFLLNLKKRKELTSVFTFFSTKFPQYEMKLDRKVAMQKGVNIAEAMENLNILVGSTYDQGFIRFNQFLKVYAQAAPEFRRLPTDVLKLYAKNDKGEMVPYSAFMSLVPRQGPNEITRYNVYLSAPINAVPAPGYTTGDAIKAIKEVAATSLPKNFDVAWEGLTYDEAARGNEAVYIFMVVVAFVYLVLAAQYESFILPFSVILSLPPGLFGSFFLLKGMGLANDIYAQVGLIMLVGLLGKNAVLIVEFAKQKQEEGITVLEAAIEGAKARFRPILMTSFAFIAGLIPLVIAHGPGAHANKTIGASALGGMLFGTVFGVVLIPGLYYIFATMAEGKSLIKNEDDRPLTEEGHHYVN
ncbi:MAG: efflux RND transporter permease subunit [Bacteriovoracaceae bacterium]|nr:efflux RND transporter permease subunit [Bacteriovoracaceae bacterium]